MTDTSRMLVLHIAVLALLFALQFVLPTFHHGNLARIMVLAIRLFEASSATALIAGIVTGVAISLIIGALALRAVGIAFMIVTLMFAQVGYLTILFFWGIHPRRRRFCHPTGRTYPLGH